MFFRTRKNQPLQLFVSIGAGLNQIPLIREAKKLGFQVIGVDTNASAPGFCHCDLKIQESIHNHAAIHKKLLELLVDGEILGIMTKSYGPAILTTAYLAEKFKLPFLPFSSGGIFLNKRKTKSLLRKHSLPTPPAVPISLRNEEWAVPEQAFPIVMKPNVGHAKMNVRLIDGSVEFKRHVIPLIAAKADIIIERFIPGDEIIAAGVIHEGTYHLAAMTDKITSPPPYFVDTMHAAPSRHLNMADSIVEIGQKVATAFGIVSSPLIMECVISESGPCLIEAVPEFGGEFIPDVLIPAHSGYNIIRESIKSMSGRGFTPPGIVRHKPVVVKYITGTPGVLASFNPEGPRKVRGILFSRIFKEIGAPISEPSTNHDRIGVVAVTGRTLDEAVELAGIAAENFNIRIK
ncbi:MAG: ATP-grasp domain-containing protein [Spirochaetes bacterium]|nr:ATP-grasp domain-containing protein [Spirochaetota bacterium]